MKLDRYQVASYTVIMGMEACWLYAWIDLLGQKANAGVVAVLPLLLIYPLAFIINRFLQRLSWHSILLNSISWVIWAGAMLLMVKLQLYRGLVPFDSFWIKEFGYAFLQILRTLHPELFILFSSIPLWWFGQRMSHNDANFMIVISEFQFGIAIMIAAFFVAGQLQININGSVPVIIIFACCGLLGLAIAHAREGKGWLTGVSHGHWPVLLVGSVGLVIAVGLLVSFLVTPDILEVFLNALKWVGNLIVRILAFLANLIPIGSSGPIEPLPTPGPDESSMLEEFTSKFFPESFRSGAKAVFGITIIVFIIIALWQVSSQIASWLRRRARGTSGAEVKSLHGAFRADLWNLCKKIWYRIIGLSSLFRGKTRKEVVSPEVATVRQIYHQLLRWAAGTGYPRQMAETPHEYLATLAQILPEMEGDLSWVTQLYVSTRYGSFLPTEGELAQMKQSWRNIKQGGKK